MKYLYLFINIFTIAIPLAFSFHPKIKFNLYFKCFMVSSLFASSIMLVWDMIFTQKGIWGFNEQYILGFYLYNLPIEEVLFFFCIPFACLFTYHSLNLFFQRKINHTLERNLILFIICLLFIIGIYFHNQLYTLVCLLSLSLLLFILKFVIKVNWLCKLIWIYPVLLIPFMIVNGILTGSGLQAPVVWYNNAAIIGIRILTIPLEDFFYGFELLLLNLFFFERLKSKYTVHNKYE